MYNVLFNVCVSNLKLHLQQEHKHPEYPVPPPLGESQKCTLR